MNLYTWGDQQCCLPAGATHAWLDPRLSQSRRRYGCYLPGGQGTGDRSCRGRRSHSPMGGAPHGGGAVGRPNRESIRDAPQHCPAACHAESNGRQRMLCPSPFASRASFREPVLRIMTASAWCSAIMYWLTAGAPSTTRRCRRCRRSILRWYLTTSGGCERCAAAIQSPEVIRYNPQLASGPLTFADPYSAVDTTGAPSPAINALNSRVLDGILPSITLHDSAEPRYMGTADRSAAIAIRTRRSLSLRPKMTALQACVSATEPSVSRSFPAKSSTRATAWVEARQAMSGRILCAALPATMQCSLGA